MTRLLVLWLLTFSLAGCHMSMSDLLLPRGQMTNQKHLRIVPTQVKYFMDTAMNSSGFVTDAHGVIPDMIDWLARRYHFSYSYVPSSANLSVDDDPKRRGKLNFLKTGVAVGRLSSVENSLLHSFDDGDVVVGIILITPERFKNADFLMPWINGPFITVIPYPQLVSHVKWGAVLQPWSTTVWICVILCLLIVIASLGSASYYLGKVATVGNRQPPKLVVNMKQITDYVLSTLLSQGNDIQHNRLAIRWVAGAWCLACFVLLQSYNCILTSALTSPTEKKPIINSVYDIPKVKDLKVVVAHRLGSESAILSANSGIFKQFGDMLRSDPSLICNSIEECLERVRSGSHVYIETIVLVQRALLEDYKKTGVCHYSLAKESFWPRPGAFAVAKNSRYTEQFNRGIIQLLEYGLPDQMRKIHSPEERAFCFTKPSRKKPEKFVLNLKSLTSAFMVLVVGYCISLLVFIGEKSIDHCRRRAIIVV